ncbi:hypothetical protein GCM10008942_19270 [Rhizomicrobium electricum]|uniref:Uncharacterized protein n=1 Tax=Rhizomicrobium electricum TaxID=480070 RepID=A0ABN1EP17_9PROT
MGKILAPKQEVFLRNDYVDTSTQAIWRSSAEFFAELQGWNALIQRYGGTLRTFK